MSNNYYIGKFSPSQIDGLTYHTILGPFSSSEVEQESAQYNKAGVHHHILDQSKNIADLSGEKMKKIETVKIGGKSLWKMTQIGPRGGKIVNYLYRRDGETEPSPWRIWSWRAKDVDITDVVSVGF